MSVEVKLSEGSDKKGSLLVAKCGVVGAAVVSHLANAVVGGYKGVMDSRGISCDVSGVYCSLLASNIVTGAGIGHLFRKGSPTNSFVEGALADGVASPVEFVFGYGVGYVGDGILNRGYFGWIF